MTPVTPTQRRVLPSPTFCEGRSRIKLVGLLTVLATLAAAPAARAGEGPMVKMMLPARVAGPTLAAKAPSSDSGQSPQTSTFSPIQVSISMPSSVSLNSPTVVTCSVFSAMTFTPVSLRLEVPPAARVLGPATITIDSIQADSTIVRTFPINIVDTGYFSIAAYVRTVFPGTSQYGSYDIIYISADLHKVTHTKTLVVKRTPESRRAVPITPEKRPAPPPLEKHLTPPLPKIDTRRILPLNDSASQEPQQHTKSPAGTVRFTGRLYFRDTSGSDRPARWATGGPDLGPGMSGSWATNSD